MTDLRGWQRVLFGVMVLLLALSLPACTCADEFERLINELIAQLIEEIEQAIREWWQNLVEDIKQQIADWWEDRKQDWRDFWASVYPPAPTITAPDDGTVAPSGAIGVRGTGLPGGTVILLRNGKHHRDTTVNAVGEWQMDGVILHKGENTFTARVKKRLFLGSASDPVRVTFPGKELVQVPAMSPAIDPTLDPHVWMVELALEQLKADGETFYEGRRAAFTAALRAGLQASKEDDAAHRFTNLDVPLTFDEHLLAFLVPKDTPKDEILEALSKAVESAVLDKAVRQELILQITESFERMDLTWTVEEGGETFTFEYVRVELDRTYLLEHFDPRALSKFRVRLGTELITGLLGEVSGSLVEKAVKMGFALWGRADADSQAQHYYDLAVRAWNHRDIDGAPLRWDDPANNAFDGDMGYNFATNEEWAIFYLGRATFYMQSPADPYYTIPYYKPEADLYAFMARKGVSELAKKLIEKKVAAAFGTVLGGARPITQIFATKEILEWMTHFLRYQDAREVRDEHRPNFAEFVAGSKYDYPMPDGLKSLGATAERVGYPFRGPSDFMLHDYLEASSLTVWERGKNPPAQFDVGTLLENGVEQEFASWTPDDVRKAVRDIGAHAAGYVHPGNIIQSDKRVPEGDMIYGSPYFIREVFSCQRTDDPAGVWWEAPQGSRLRLTWLDGTLVEGVVDYQPGQPEQVRYVGGKDYVTYVPVHVVGLDEVSYMAGHLDSFPFSAISLVSVVGDEQHLYAAFDASAAIPPEADSTVVPSLMTVLVGMAGNRNGPPDLVERDGAARIAADRLMVGTLATWHLLGRFAAEAPAYRPPDPVVVGPGDLGVGMGSSAELHLYDQRGRHVGPNSAGGVDLDIPGGRYFTNPETDQQFIVIPHADLGEKYAVQVEGTGSGDFDLNLFYTDRRRRQAIRLAYDDVPLNPDTVAELAVRADDTHTLRMDDDGNGTFDQEMLPSRTIEVAVFELSRAPSIPGLVVVGMLLMALGAVGMWVTLRRRRRHRQLAPAPVVQAPPTCVRCGTVARPGARFCPRCGGPLAAAAPALPVCAQCGAVAKRPGARFCPHCGSQLPATASPRPQPRSATRRRVSGRLMVALSALAMLLCFFLPWVDCSGLQVSGWEIPGSFGTINFRGTLTGPPGYVVYLVPLSAAVALLLLRWARRKIAGGLHILIGGRGLLFVSWAFLGGGALACSRWGLWGTIVGLVGIVWGGIKEIRE